MENKINIAELLKDCPQGMELDCVLYEDCYLFDIDAKSNNYLIKITTPMGIKDLDKYGCYTTGDKSKCVIFPKGKTTWEGFVPPGKFKDGDIVTNIEGAVIIYQEITIYGYCGSFISLDHFNQFIPHYKSYLIDTIRLATEEEKQKLFDAIKRNGCLWNAETKTLEKLIVPKFKTGDRIKHKVSDLCCTLGEYSKGISAYRTNIGLSITYKDLEQWELASNKFDITTLKPFKSNVLIRNDKTQKWIPAFWGYKTKDGYVTTFGACRYCIPYEGNENLLTTNNDCDEFYKTWEE